MSGRRWSRGRPPRATAETSCGVSSRGVAGADDFDFWLGSWVASWGEEGATGRNVIARSFDGRVVEERFDGRPGVEFRG